MGEYEKLGKDAFKSTWSREEKLTPSHQIVAVLRSSGRKQNEELALAARQKYSQEQFDNLFSYKSKDGARKVLTSPAFIAKRFLSLSENPVTSQSQSEGSRAHV